MTLRDGVAASRLQLPPGAWDSLLDGLCARFPAVPRTTWLDRFARGLVQDASGVALVPDRRWETGLEIRYWREVADEPVVAGVEHVLHVDAHLVVADKPHGLPVTPAGGHVRETLIARLVRRLGNPHLVPLHRIDRDTAGLVLFSAQPASRDAYQALFRDRAITKTYEAVAPPLPDGDAAPRTLACRLVRGTPFFRMAVAPGAPDAFTRLEVITRGERDWHYRLLPVTGRKHQLRVQMAAAGAPIRNDPLYPDVRAADPDAPLQLLARALAFDDPVDGRPRRFESAHRLAARDGDDRVVTIDSAVREPP